MMRLMRNKKLVSWVVGIVIAGTVFAYVPLLFIPATGPSSPENAGTTPEDSSSTAPLPLATTTATDSPPFSTSTPLPIPLISR
jgi:hypothetical protein